MQVFLIAGATVLLVLHVIGKFRLITTKGCAINGFDLITSPKGKCRMNKWKPFHSWSLKWKSLLLLLVLITIPTFSVSSMIYYQSNNILKQQVIDNTYQTLLNMELNLASVMEDVEDISGYMIFSEQFRRYMTLSPRIEDEHLEEIYGLQSNIQAFLTFHLTNKRYFNSITIEGMNGLRLHVGDRVSGDEGKWRRSAEERKGRVVWTDPYVMERGGWDMEDARVFSMFRIINDLYSIVEPVGRVVIRLDADELYDYIGGGQFGDEQETFLLRDNGVVVFHRDPERLGATYPDSQLLQLIESAHEAVIPYQREDEILYAVTRRVKDLDYTFVSLVREDYILAEVAGIRSTMRWMLFVFGALSLIALLGFVLAIIKPILELTKETKRLEDGDFKARVQVRSKDEIGTLGMRFNKAVSHIERLIDTKYKLEIQNKEAELKALQSQMKPHFLYNTLDMIRWTARMEGALETSKSIEDLARLFRLNLSKGKLWIPLQDEMKYLQSYLELQKRRQVHPFTYLAVMEAGLEKALVMKIILQPLAENSIQHGFTALEKEHRLYVRAYKVGADIVIDVIDNGAGMNVDEINAWLSAADDSRCTHGFALKNIHERIANAFGSPYGLEVMKTEPGTGAFVRVRLPYIDDEKELMRIIHREGS